MVAVSVNNPMPDTSFNSNAENENVPKYMEGEKSMTKLFHYLNFQIVQIPFVLSSAFSKYS